MAHEVVEDIEDVAQALQKAARKVDDPLKTELRGLSRRLNDVVHAMYESSSTTAIEPAKKKESVVNGSGNNSMIPTGPRAMRSPFPSDAHTMNRPPVVASNDSRERSALGDPRLQLSTRAGTMKRSLSEDVVQQPAKKQKATQHAAAATVDRKIVCTPCVKAGVPEECDGNGRCSRCNNEGTPQCSYYACGYGSRCTEPDCGRIHPSQANGRSPSYMIKAPKIPLAMSNHGKADAFKQACIASTISYIPLHCDQVASADEHPAAMFGYEGSEAQ